MKVHVEFDESVTEAEVTIRAAKGSPELARLQRLLAPQPTTLTVLQGSREHFLPLGEVLFIETAERSLAVHTRTEIFQLKRSLQAVAGELPPNFQQIAKSTIVNLTQVSAVERAIANCAVSFYQSYKQVYASRRYYKQLLARLAETRSGQ